ncbi:MAG: hypothetical protein ACYS9X_15810 [Planctomycetota bacterium]|jgi:hypothetical protein
MMGFAILWLAGLASGALLVALALAQGVRMKEGRLATGLPFIAALVPFALGAVASVVAEKLHSQGLRPSHLAYALSWTTAVVIAAVCVIHFGSRRASESAPMPATRWPRGILAGALGAAIAIYVGTLLCMDARARRDLEEVKAEAIRMAESVAPKPVPDDRNAALVYERAFEAMGKWDNKTWSRLGTLARDRETDAATDHVAELLRERRDILALLHEAASMPDYYFETQYVPPDPGMRMPKLLTLRHAADLLALDARHRAAKGDMRGALEDVAATWGMARHVADAPTLIICLFAVAVDAVGSGPVQDVLASGPVRRADLQGLPLDPDVSFVEAHTKGWKMESAFVLRTVAEPYTWEMEGKKYRSNPGGMHWRVFVAPAFLAWCRPRMRLVQEAISSPYHVSRNRYLEVEEDHVVELGVLSNFAMVSLQSLRSTSLAVAQTEARHRLAVLGIAAACFRTEEGRYPEKLTELVPGYISAVPVDPFDGKPLKMLPEGDGMVLYSVGWDGEDDRGKDSHWSYGGVDDKGDISFRLGEAYTSALANAKAPKRGRRGRTRKR